MKQVFLDIQEQLYDTINKASLENMGIDCERGITVGLWNGQTENIEQGMQIPFQVPAMFIEFVPPTQIVQLGNGVQLYEPLDVRVHIIHQFFDSKDGQNEQDLVMFDLRNAVFKSLQMFIPTNSANMYRIDETPDYSHTDMVHYIQTYRTNWMDDSQQFPVGGEDYTPDPDLTLDLTRNPE